MSSNQPSFGEPPAEVLEGGDPKKIAAWYANQAQQSVQTRYNELQTSYNNEVANLRQTESHTPPPSEDRPTNSDFYTDPNGAIDRRFQNANFVKKEEFDQMNSILQNSAIATAEMLAREGKPHWNRFLKEIREVMKSVPPHQRAVKDFWDVAYNNIVGSHAQELVEEGKREVMQQPTSESVGTDHVQLENELKRPLDPDTARVMDRLGVTSENYRKSEQRLKGAQQWPMASLQNNRK